MDKVPIDHNKVQSNAMGSKLMNNISVSSNPTGKTKFTRHVHTHIHMYTHNQCKIHFHEIQLAYESHINDINCTKSLMLYVMYNALSYCKDLGTLHRIIALGRAPQHAHRPRCK